ncbi:MAG: peptidylprolyl isomerase [Planctomycetota bacterium]
MSADPLPDENPMLVWLHQNRLFLVLIVVALLLGALLKEWIPNRQRAARLASWDHYRNMGLNSLSAFQGKNLPGTLDDLREDARIYPWVVLNATQIAFQAGDREALTLLKGELGKLVEGQELADARLPENGQGVSILQEVLDKVDAELAAQGTRFADPPPQGKKIKIILKSDGGETYELTFGLYSEAAPTACARFLKAIEAGTLIGKEAGLAGLYRLKFDGMDAGEEEPGPLPLEKKWGFFHEAGVLATLEKPGTAEGEQEADEFALVRQEAYGWDGRTTVFGKLVDGQVAMDEIQQLPSDPNNPTRLAQKLTISAAEILP